MRTGNGRGIDRPEHRRGEFTVDHDACRALEPSARRRESCSAKVTYDLRQLPAMLHIELRRSANQGTVEVTEAHEAEGAGSVEMRALADLDGSKQTSA